MRSCLEPTGEFFFVLEQMASVLKLRAAHKLEREVRNLVFGCVQLGVCMGGVG